MTEAKLIFEKYVSLGQSFDPAIVDLYSDDAVITNTRRYPDGTARTMSLPAPTYKKLIQETLPLAKTRGDTDEFSEVTYTAQGDDVRITATRYSYLKKYSSPFSVTIANRNGKWLVVEEISESLEVGALIELIPGLFVDATNQDVTFQELPHMGTDKFLCLWDGQDMKGFAAAGHDKYDKDLKSFVKYIDKGMKAEGVRQMEWRNATALGTGPDHLVHRYDQVFFLDGAQRSQIYYVVRSPTGYYSVVVSVTDKTAYDAVRSRFDQMLGAVILKKQSPTSG